MLNERCCLVILNEIKDGEDNDGKLNCSIIVFISSKATMLNENDAVTSYTIYSKKIEVVAGC